MKKYKIISILLVLIFLCDMWTLDVKAAENECSNPYHQPCVETDYGRMIVYRDGCVEVNFAAGAADSDTFHRYRTIGFTLTRGSHDADGNPIIWKDKEGKTRSIGFSFDGANAIKTSETIDGIVYTKIRFSFEGIKEKLWNYDPSWCMELERFASQQTDNICMRYDSIITMIYDDGNERIQYGYLIDDGKSQYPTTIGITYWNIPEARCQECDSNAIFAYCAEHGYWPFFDASIADRNLRQNEKICWNH